MDLPKKIKHGGPRPGSGRKPLGYVPPQEKIDFDREKARNERAKADLNEFALAVKRGYYVDRAAVRQATAMALAALAQTLRSVPDNIERKLGVHTDIAAEIGVIIDAALNDTADAFETMLKTKHGARESD